MTEIKIDKMLATSNRVLRAYPGRFLFGPTGERLFADCLTKRPGFCGNIDFIHKVNLDMLFEIECSEHMHWYTAETMWYPSHLLLMYKDDVVEFYESKHMNRDDTAFCNQTWINHGTEPYTLQLKVCPSGCINTRSRGYYFFQMPQPLRDYRVGGCVGWQFEGNTITVAPGEKVNFIVAAVVGNMETETMASITDKLDAFLKKGLTPDEYSDESIAAYQKFFDQVPVFTSDDLLFDKTWWYRWYILRNATSTPNFGYLQYPTVYEGRAHKTSKTPPLSVRGWEFSRLINLSSPLQMTDYRWFPDKELLHQFVRGYMTTGDENGVLQSVFTNHRGGGFANFLIWAIYRMYLVDGDKEFLKEILPKAKAVVDGTTKVYSSENDLLQVEKKHQRTGKEYQPSYWYFTDFPTNGRDKSKITPLKRIDSSVYHYLNIKGLGLMMQAVGDPESEKYLEMAKTLADQINEKTWDETTKFYYDLHYQTDEKAMVKNIVGIYPYWAEISDELKLEGLEKLFDPAYFNTGSVFSSVARDCVAYAPYGGWMGTMRSRDSCMWDGPSWPYTNGIALDAIGRQSKLHVHRYDEQFGEFLRKYARQHYRNGNMAEPYLVEQYHAETGENLSDEPDYNHSYFNDLIVTYVAGVDVYEDRVVINPLDIGLKYFHLYNLQIRGKCFDIELTKDGMFVVKVDGKLISETKGFAKVHVPL